MPTEYLLFLVLLLHFDIFFWCRSEYESFPMTLLTSYFWDWDIGWSLRVGANHLSFYFILIIFTFHDYLCTGYHLVILFFEFSGFCSRLTRSWDILLFSLSLFLLFYIYTIPLTFICLKFCCMLILMLLIPSTN